MKQFLIVLIVASALIGAVAPVIADAPLSPVCTRLLLAPDISGSLDTLEFSRVIQHLSGALPALVMSLGVTEVGLLPWAASHDCWLSPEVSVQLSTRPVLNYSPPRLTEAERLFRLARDRREAEARAEYERRKAVAEAEYRRSIIAALQPVRERLSTLHQGQAPCTAVIEALTRSHEESPATLILLITDGVEECTDPQTVTDGLSPGARTLVILVPSVKDIDGTGESLSERRQWIHRVAPWANVLHSFELVATPEEWLLPLLQEVPRPRTFEAAGRGASQ